MRFCLSKRYAKILCSLQALRLPSEVDDEQITPNAIHPQPIGRTPLIAGFNISTNLFR